MPASGPNLATWLRPQSVAAWLLVVLLPVQAFGIAWLPAWMPAHRHAGIAAAPASADAPLTADTVLAVLDGHAHAGQAAHAHAHAAGIRHHHGQGDDAPSMVLVAGDDAGDAGTAGARAGWDPPWPLLPIAGSVAARSSMQPRFAYLACVVRAPPPAGLLRPPRPYA